MRRTLASNSAESKPLPSSRPDATERRSAERQPASGSVVIQPGNEATLIDWSAGGFALESDRAVRVGETYLLSWWLGVTPRPLAGIVRWSRLKGTRAGFGGDVAPVFRSGFELVEMCPRVKPESAGPSPNLPSPDLRGNSRSSVG